MWSYLVFSSYLFLLCGLRVMCHPNRIISDPDFHLHVGGLLNPIPGKLFSILQVCVRSFLKSSSVLRSLPEAISGTGVNAECVNVPRQAYDCIWIERTYMSAHVQIKEHERMNTQLFYLALPSLPFSLCFSVFLLSFFLIRYADFSSALNPFLSSIKSIICPSVCHVFLVIITIFLVILCSFFLFGSFMYIHVTPFLTFLFYTLLSLHFFFLFLMFLLHISFVSLQNASLMLVDGTGLSAPVRWRKKNEWSLVMPWTVSGQSRLLLSPRSVQYWLILVSNQVQSLTHFFPLWCFLNTKI